MVQRWVLRTTDLAQSLVFDNNPKDMTTPFAPKNVTIDGTTAIDGQVLLTEGLRKPHEWKFTGTIRTLEFYTALQTWFYRRERLYLDDHYRRRWLIYLTQFDTTPKRSVGVPWRHDYSMTALVLTEPVFLDA